MVKRGFILVWILFIFTVISLSSQVPKSIINDDTLLAEIKIGLDNIYNGHFDKALQTYEYLKQKRPDHPVTPFFYGLAIYWGNYPLIDESNESNEFENAMRKCMELAEPIWEQDKNDIEGVFFELVSRAMLMMYFSDKGHSGRVLKLAPTAYKQLLKSFELKELFKEFYFITGLYSYYIEAYPERNPVYKPITFIFKSGDKKRGLEELHYTLDSTVFMKNEAAIFLSIIYYDFEKNNDSAIAIMQRLVDKYPNNAYFTSQYIEYLLNGGQYEECIELNQEMVKNNRKNAYIVMKGVIFKGLIEEKYRKNYSKAKRSYELGVKLADSIENMGNDFKSYALYGLSRIEKINGNLVISKDYKKQADELSRYDHFTE